eukprot:5522748-Pyramimonas_sp.AAC.1
MGFDGLTPGVVGRRSGPLKGPQKRHGQFRAQPKREKTAMAATGTVLCFRIRRRADARINVFPSRSSAS